jgi:hypothetical protein
MFDFERWHFEPHYQAEVDPEFPGDGDWRCRVLGYARTGEAEEPFESRWGTPAIVRVGPAEAESWVGMFASGGLGGVTAFTACPAPDQLAVGVDGLVYLVDVTDPAKVLARHDQVTQIVAVAGEPLLLLVSFTDMIALGADGVRWKTRRIALDGLRVVGASADEIVASCDNLEGSDTIVLDARTGDQTGGLRFESFWPPDALA